MDPIRRMFDIRRLNMGVDTRGGESGTSGLCRLQGGQVDVEPCTALLVQYHSSRRPSLEVEVLLIIRRID